MNRIIVTVIFILLIPIITWSQKEQNNTDNPPKYTQSVSFKPFNYANINLNESDEMGLIQFGVEYERLLKNSHYVSFVFPFTYTRYFTGIITDYKKSGNQYYFSPGIKFYLNDYDQIKGFAISTHLLLGYRSYTYSSMIVKNGSAKGKFLGVIANAHYNFKIGEQWGINTELGFGVRYLNEKGEETNYDFPATSFSVYNHKKLSGIMNISLGINYRF